MRFSTDGENGNQILFAFVIQFAQVVAFSDRIKLSPVVLVNGRLLRLIRRVQPQLAGGAPASRL
jgi:hypothetical protein